ncbi:MAG: DUF2029 domain-containing protein, partial [Candidatus Dormibacteraeota bacterium]|nr:DUF2029 domain-containing protein [Candidatus Dormibacteraeota bacterium]
MSRIRQVPRLTRARWCLLALLLAVLGGHYVVLEIQQFANPHAAGVDFAVYYRAAQRIAHGGLLYSSPPPCCFSNGTMDGRYTYPPLFAFLLSPLSALSIDDAARIWLVVCQLSLAAILVVALRAAPARVGREGVLWYVLAIVGSSSVL